MKFVVHNVRDLEAQGCRIQTSTLDFQGRHFQRGPRFRKALQLAIRDYCTICQSAGQGILLVEEEFHITAWKQVNKFSSNRPRRKVSSDQGHTEMRVPVKTEPLETVSPAKPADGDFLSPDFIDYSRQALLVVVGPIANLIFDEVLSQAADMDALDFIYTLSKRIPKKKLVGLFQSQIMAYQSNL